MWHPVKRVASNHRLDADALEAFALENETVYQIVEDYGYAEVSTWFVNDLVRDFRDSISQPPGE